MTGQPGPGQPGMPPPKPPAGYMPPEEERSGMHPLVIVAIVVAVLVVLVGLLLLVLFVFPFLLCAGTSAYNINRVNQEIQAERERIEQPVDGQGNDQIRDIQKAAAEKALLVQLTKRLYPLAKVDIGLHWTEPGGVRRRRWADWQASKVTDNRYAISGKLDLGIKDVGTQTYNWKCEYTTTDDPKSPQANWVLQTITIDGQQVYP